MARRPPAFERNVGAVRHLQTRTASTPESPSPRLCLTGWPCTGLGRARPWTHAGGLTKFEPGGRRQRLTVRGADITDAIEHGRRIRASQELYGMTSPVSTGYR